jgi:hypothetical protein
MNQEVECNNCVVQGQGQLPTGQIVPIRRNRPMEFVGQYPVQGVHTFAFHCLGCNGRAYLQNQRDPRTGRPALVPVQLRGSEVEYQPNYVRPQEQVQVQVAYTLGQSASAAASHIPAPPITTPMPSVQLDPRIGRGTMITPDHPMHPENVRKRIQPVRPEELLGNR